jgi:hypothetical protein
LVGQGFYDQAIEEARRAQRPVEPFARDDDEPRWR